MDPVDRQAAMMTKRKVPRRVALILLARATIYTFCLTAAAWLGSVAWDLPGALMGAALVYTAYHLGGTNVRPPR
jgi:hypothetical protein